MQKVELNVGPNGNQTLTILEGKALEQKYPNKIAIVGNIDAISGFLAKRYANGVTGKGLQFVDPQTAVVLVDEQAMRIDLKLDPQDPFGAEVTAVLEFTEELNQWRINAAGTFKREEVVKLLRFNKRFFQDPERYEKVLAAFQSFKLQTNADIQMGGDTRGNKSIGFEKKVMSDNGMPPDFILQLPIFKGQTPVAFRVEICFDTTEASVRFWFESTELAELIETKRKELFAKQLASCTDFVVIHK